MNNIDKLKEMNITFNSIVEESASKIMQEEYFFQLFKCFFKNIIKMKKLANLFVWIFLNYII